LYEQIASNKRRTFLLVAAFLCLIFLVAWAFDQLVGMGKAGIVLAVIIAAAMTMGSYYYSDRVVLAMSRAGRGEGEFPYLYNVVEGLALAAGIPAPKCYVIEDTAPNAFATAGTRSTRSSSSPPASSRR